MSFQLPTTEEKSDYVLKQFDRIAKRYDLTNDVISLGMHRFWKEVAVKELVQDQRRGALHAPSCNSRSFLDVCTGTGDLALLIAKKLRNGDKVIGADFSPEMLKIANQRASSAQRKDQSPAMIGFKQADAQALPFDDNSFDGVIVSFGLRNLTDLQKGINEMTRVTKPGGRVINLDLGHTDTPLFAQLFNFYFGSVVPIVGDLLQSDRQAYTYLPESLKTYPTPDKIAKMFAQAGLTNIKWRKLAMGTVALHVGEK
ncbi:MAG: bifunctional demethylmenaquinone methyltransferase/2-methoxy-6-polyprenyl-1,4-benzoquinol methylase UbiE [Candidatus Obscuribacterales bacterium]|nr:bifunctional demethylmenaquinone methyltransferase/2-methoxy-6-polyprenyl-1,4-benzoquinol methylase UbiE [Candidatus Obscuribacterales bacterium]